MDSEVVRFRCLLVIVCVLVATGCQDKNEASRNHLDRGDAYFVAKKYPEAAIEYRNSIQLTPLAPQAHFKLGEVLAAQSAVDGALAAYLRAADLDPDNVEAQLKASHLLLLAGQFADVRTRLRAVLVKHPDNATAALMLGNAMAALGDMEEGMAANRRAIALDPKRAGNYVNLGALLYKQGAKAEAEASYKNAVSIEPNSLMARLGLADFFWLERRVQDAERMYKEALALDPANLRANRAIADFYIASGRILEAEKYLKKVAETGRAAENWYTLADYYVATRRRPQALQILYKLRKEAPHYSEATVRIAFMATIDRQPAQAKRLLDEVLQKNPNYAPALALRAHLFIADRKRVEALAVAEQAVKADIKSEAAYLAHAVAAEANGSREGAIKSYLEVLKLNPGSAEALIELARLYLETKNVGTALDYAEQTVRSNPDLVEARLMRLNVLANHSERQEDAMLELATLLKRYPNSHEVLFQAGQVAVGRKRYSEAYRYFARAREIKPDYMHPLIEMIKLDVQEKKLADAKRRVDLLVSKSPESLESLLIAGTTYALIDGAVAEAYLRKALKLDPSNINADKALAALYLKQNRLDKAREEFVNITKREPLAVAPATMLGIIYEVQGNKQEAERAYLNALRINPHAAAASNNLAWLYVEQGKNLDQALDLALTARKELPRQAEVTDTLGWIYLRKGMLSQAVRALQDAVDQDPFRALYHYHLGLAYAQSGEYGRARVSLQKSLKLEPNFSQSADARRELQKLLY
jgi:tetratricopeptide (TPR) repeat protein